jgi:putative flippase GtrA
MAKSKKREVSRFVEYLISGGVYFWVGYVLLLWLYNGLGWSLWWATIISNLIGWSVNYALQRYWVFRNPQLSKHKTEVTGRYIFITLVDFVLNYFILAFLNGLGITPKFGQFISSGFFTIWNYLWYRLWVFPEKFTKRRPAKVTAARVAAHRPHGHSAYHTVRG